MSVPPIRVARNVVLTSLRRSVHASGSPCCGNVDLNKQTCEQQQENGFRASTRAEAH